MKFYNQLFCLTRYLLIVINYNYQVIHIDMVKIKRDPDDLISALSKNLKAEKSPVVKITFKRGDLFQKEFTKAHSRKAKK